MLRIRPVLSFRDGKIEKFDELMTGVNARARHATASGRESEDAPNEALRGKTVTATFEVKEVKRLELPELTRGIPRRFGRLRVGGRSARRRARQSPAADGVPAAASCPGADHRGADGVGHLGACPRICSRRQSERELSRAVMELRRSGFGDEDDPAPTKTSCARTACDRPPGP